MVRRAVFPGSFDPLTVAHLAIADAVHDQIDVSAVDLALSRVALAKEHRDATPAPQRVAEILRHRGGRSWLGAHVTEAQLLVDIAEGYDVLVIGADKWHQLVDPGFYGSVAARDDALRRLPRLAVAPRAGASLPAHDDVIVLALPDHHLDVSSSAVRRGRTEWRA